MKFKDDNKKCAHPNHTLCYDNYLSALCSRCNLKVVRQKELKVVCRNSSYDMNFLLDILQVIILGKY